MPTAIRCSLRQIYFALRPSVKIDSTRYAYSHSYIRHEFRPRESVLDIGSGGDPFPFASILTDRYLEPSHHRSVEFRSQDRPVVVSDIQALPFADRHFDYVVCSHVLEHVENPIQACRELQRVGGAGFIETPTFMKDALFSWAKGMHKWHVTSIANRLVFFEYSQRQLEGIQSNEWYQLVFGRTYHPLQKIFRDNQDIFNVLFEWKDRFEVTVMTLDGRVSSL